LPPDDLKSKGEIALIIERATWAAWIMQYKQPAAKDVEQSVPVGSWIAEELNTIGVSDLAGVTLGTH